MTGEKLWHKSYAPGVPYEVDIEKVTMAEVLSRTAKKYPDKTAFIYMGKKISYSELERLVNRFARSLMDLGVKKGDKVGFVLPNLPQLVIAIHAAYKLGAVTVMNNPLYTELELQNQLNDSDCKLVIILDLLLPRILKIKANTQIEKIVTCHINDYLPFPVKQLFPFVKKNMYRKIEPQKYIYEFMDLIKKYPVNPVDNTSEWDDLAALIYTGGTTGVSKGAMLTHANISSVLQQWRAWFPTLKDGEEIIMGIYPIFHSAGYSVSMNMSIFSGWTNILIPRPEPKGIIDALKKYRPTFLPGVPTIYQGLLNEERFRRMDLSFIKGFFAGAAPLPEDTLDQLKQLHGAVIHDVYGATENTAFAVASPFGGRIKQGTVGVPLPNTDIKIMDAETGKIEQKTGDTGEICIKGPQVMKGYYKKPEETSNTLRDGWFYTGDIGYIDEDGYISIVDRKKDIIISGGYNIYPIEVDNVLFAHPKILEACVIGVPDEYRGESVKAYIVPKPGESVDEQEIIQFCKQRLAAYKVPKIIEFTDSLPKSAVGKILRRELRDMDRKKREEKT
ncbi:MAG: long-chain fatty acid--CoA ligase [Deltaproteobacteria bacterium]|nr:long-chain fatty acid--CoA ligase [Deltaproteobacteria bacterium]